MARGTQSALSVNGGASITATSFGVVRVLVPVPFTGTDEITRARHNSGESIPQLLRPGLLSNAATDQRTAFNYSTTASERHGWTFLLDDQQHPDTRGRTIFPAGAVLLAFQFAMSYSNAATVGNTVVRVDAAIHIVNRLTGEVTRLEAASGGTNVTLSTALGGSGTVTMSSGAERLLARDDILLLQVSTLATPPATAVGGSNTATLTFRLDGADAQRGRLTLPTGLRVRFDEAATIRARAVVAARMTVTRLALVVAVAAAVAVRRAEVFRAATLPAPVATVARIVIGAVARIVVPVVVAADRTLLLVRRVADVIAPVATTARLTVVALATPVARTTVTAARQLVARRAVVQAAPVVVAARIVVGRVAAVTARVVWRGRLRVSKAATVVGRVVTAERVTVGRVARIAVPVVVTADRTLVLARRVAAIVAPVFVPFVRSAIFVRKGLARSVLHIDDRDRNGVRLGLPAAAVPASTQVITEERAVSPDVVLVDGRPAVKVSDPDLYTGA